MIEEDWFLELAGLCSKTCHALETVDDLGRFNEHIEDLGRYVGPACLFESDRYHQQRVVSNIESAASIRAECAREHLHVPEEDPVNTWRKELGGILSFFDVRCRQITAPAPQSLNRVFQGASKPHANGAEVKGVLVVQETECGKMLRY